VKIVSILENTTLLHGRANESFFILLALPMLGRARVEETSDEPVQA
jgi:hypothetical protein